MKESPDHYDLDLSVTGERSEGTLIIKRKARGKEGTVGVMAASLNIAL